MALAAQDPALATPGPDLEPALTCHSLDGLGHRGWVLRRSIHAVCGEYTAGKGVGEPCSKRVSMIRPESWHLAGPLAALFGLLCVCAQRETTWQSARGSFAGTLAHRAPRNPD
jgi:hypothetical protein